MQQSILAIDYIAQCALHFHRMEVGHNNGAAHEDAMSCNKAEVSAQEGEAPAIKGISVFFVMTTQAEGLEQRIPAVIDSIGNPTNDSRSISAVLIAIKNIADETNFLALNVAIEAACVCDHGRGFVLATDVVRALAKQTANSAERINYLLAKLATTNDMDSVWSNLTQLWRTPYGWRVPLPTYLMRKYYKTQKYSDHHNS